MCLVTDEDGVFKALADPTRRFLLDLLFERDGRTLTELESELEMTRFGVMKHLKVLEEAGLIRREKVGRDHIIEFRGAPLRKVSVWVHEYERFWSEHLDKLEEFFKEKRRKS